MVEIAGPNIHVPGDGVYYVESQNKDTNPLAMRIGLSEPDYIYWEDTGNGRSFHAKQIFLDGQEVTDAKSVDKEKMPRTIEFTTPDDETFKLVKLTKDIFDEKLRPLVAKGDKLDFKSDEEVQKYFAETDFYTSG